MADRPNGTSADTSWTGDDSPDYGVACWLLGVSGFIVKSYVGPLWPASLSEAPLTSLNFVHALSGMLFAGSIITTTVIEWTVVQSRDKSVARFWFRNAPGVEKALVLPALAGSIVSGTAQAFQIYGSLSHAPLHVKSVLHLLATFGLWWAITDRTTQKQAFNATDVDFGPHESLPKVMIRRRLSNIVSCGFLILLYAFMVLKPGLS